MSIHNVGETVALTSQALQVAHVHRAYKVVELLTYFRSHLLSTKFRVEQITARIHPLVMQIGIQPQELEYLQDMAMPSTPTMGNLVMDDGMDDGGAPNKDWEFAGAGKLQAAIVEWTQTVHMPQSVLAHMSAVCAHTNTFEQLFRDGQGPLTILIRGQCLQMAQANTLVKKKLVALLYQLQSQKEAQRSSGDFEGAHRSHTLHNIAEKILQDCTARFQASWTSDCKTLKQHQNREAEAAAAQQWVEAERGLKDGVTAFVHSVQDGDMRDCLASLLLLAHMLDTTEAEALRVALLQEQLERTQERQKLLRAMKELAQWPPDEGPAAATQSSETAQADLLYSTGLKAWLDVLEEICGLDPLTPLLVDSLGALEDTPVVPQHSILRHTRRCLDPMEQGAAGSTVKLPCAPPLPGGASPPEYHDAAASAPPDSNTPAGAAIESTEAGSRAAHEDSPFECEQSWPFEAELDSGAWLPPDYEDVDQPWFTSDQSDHEAAAPVAAASADSDVREQCSEDSDEVALVQLSDREMAQLTDPQEVSPAPLASRILELYPALGPVHVDPASSTGDTMDEAAACSSRPLESTGMEGNVRPLEAEGATVEPAVDRGEGTASGELTQSALPAIPPVHVDGEQVPLMEEARSQQRDEGGDLPESDLQGQLGDDSDSEEVALVQLSEQEIAQMGGALSVQS